MNEIEKQRFIEKSVQEMQKQRNDLKQELIQHTLECCKKENLSQQETDEIINDLEKMQDEVSETNNENTYREELTRNIEQFETLQQKAIDEHIKIANKELAKSRRMGIIQLVLGLILCVVVYFVFFAQK